MSARNTSRKSSILAAAIVLCVAGLPASANPEGPRKPYGKDEIIKLLRGDVSPKRVATLARKHGIDFQMTRETATELRQTGATEELLATLRELAPKPPTPQADTDAQADQHLKRGNELSPKGDWDGAIREYREAIRLKPDYAEAHSSLGAVLGDKGDAEGMIAEEREAIRLKPDYPEAHFGLGAALVAKGDWDRAIAEWREAIRLKPDYAEAHFMLGAVLEQKEDYDGAIAEEREAIRLKPDYPKAHFGLGAVLAVKGDWDGAIAEEREAIRLKPDDAETHLVLGVVLWGGKADRDGAIAELREAIRLEPDYAKAHSVLGRVLEARRHRRAALEEFRKAYELDQKNSDYRDDYERLSKKKK